MIKMCDSFFYMDMGKTTENEMQVKQSQKLKEDGKPMHHKLRMIELKKGINIKRCLICLPVALDH